jgi:hypothetical protein
MIKSLSNILERAQSWPEEAQNELERLAREIGAELGGDAYRATPEELVGIDRGLRAAEAGEFATEEDVASTFAKHRRK